MKNYVKKIFTREKAIRHIIIFLLSIIVLCMSIAIWVNLVPQAFESFKEQYEVIQEANAKRFIVLWIIGIVLSIWMAAACFGTLIVVNVRHWMLHFLKLAIFNFGGMIPIVKRYVPEEYKMEWFVWFEGFLLTSGVLKYLVFVAAVFRVVIRILKCALYIVAAVGIPVSSPFLTFIVGMLVAVLWIPLGEMDTARVLGGIIILVVMGVLFFVLHPIMSFTIDKSKSENQVSIGQVIEGISGEEM